jgi:glycosyltransferase involved in cell wall biosynthesis
VILEAIACGVPVVSTDCPSGPSEIIEDQTNGFLVPVEDEIRLADAILNILKNKNLAKRISSNAPRSLAKFSVPNIIAEYQRLLTDGS